MIYIIGTTHHIQHGDESEVEKVKIEEYAEFLETTIQERKVLVAGEEASKDSLLDYCVKKTQLQSIVEGKFRGKGLRYFYFDPDRNESKKLGIKRREDLLEAYGIGKNKVTHDLYWRINKEMAEYDCSREKVWLKKIQPYLVGSETLLVCGYAHCESLLELLEEGGYKACVLKIMG